MKETIGKLSHDLMLKQSDDTHCSEEQMRESLTDWEKNIYQAVDEGKKKYSHDFYVIVLTKKERLMHNVLRNFFYSRSSCPSPDWDQSVYKYSHSDESLDFLWVVPSKDTCAYFKDNVLTIDESERTLLKFVLDFHDGTLLKKAKKLNGEVDDSPLLERK